MNRIALCTTIFGLLFTLNASAMRRAHDPSRTKKERAAALYLPLIKQVAPHVIESAKRANVLRAFQAAAARGDKVAAGRYLAKYRKLLNEMDSPGAGEPDDELLNQLDGQTVVTDGDAGLPAPVKDEQKAILKVPLETIGEETDSEKTAAFDVEKFFAKDE